MNHRIREIINQRRRHLGRLGEMLIVKHLRAKGFEHLDSNYLKSYGEIDLVMRYKGKIHFFEVKTVSRENMIGNIGDFHVIHETNKHKPEENVSRWKITKLSRMVETYLMERRIPESVEWQFHIAIVYLDRVNKKAGIRFLRDIPMSL